MSCSVLVVDDERTLARNIQRYLGRHGYAVQRAESGAEALAVLEGFSPAVVLLDLRLPDADGIDLIPRVRAVDPAARIVIMTGYASFPTAVLAIKAGANDYLAKPLVLAELRGLIDRVRCVPPAGQPGPAGAASGLAAILGEAPAIVDLRRRIERLLAVERRAEQTPPVVLVIGETGTGKELVARALHLESDRARFPFAELNCTGLPESLAEHHLFGHERGALSDAMDARPGLIEAADGGTLFLDEVGDLGPAVQAKLLTLLEDRRVRRLGSVQAKSVDLRVVAATNRPLEQLVRAGRFRADLYFRLRVVELHVPPLRERRQDILPLASAFLAESARRWRRADLHFTAAAAKALEAHSWPGNVRELKNVVEQAAVLSVDTAIEPAQLALSGLDDQPVTTAAEPSFRLPAGGVGL